METIAVSINTARYLVPSSLHAGTSKLAVRFETGIEISLITLLYLQNFL